jgi:hypothetical protein
LTNRNLWDAILMEVRGVLPMVWRGASPAERQNA